MAKRGNPNWGNPLLPIPALLTEFEIEVARLGLKRPDYVSSMPLKRWCYRNRNRVYVPEWLRKRHRLVMDTALELRWEDGGRLVGVPAGPDQVRIHHPHGFFFDEAAFLPDFEQSYNAVLPVARQIVAISTASPGFFGDQCS